MATDCDLPSPHKPQLSRDGRIREHPLVYHFRASDNPHAYSDPNEIMNMAHSTSGDRTPERQMHVAPYGDASSSVDPHALIDLGMVPDADSFRRD